MEAIAGLFVANPTTVVFAGAVMAAVWFVRSQNTVVAEREKMVAQILQGYLDLEHRSLASALPSCADEFRLVLNLYTTSKATDFVDVEPFIHRSCEANTGEILRRWNSHDWTESPTFHTFIVGEDDGCYQIFAFECEKKEEIFHLLSASFTIRDNQIQRYRKDNPEATPKPSFD